MRRALWVWLGLALVVLGVIACVNVTPTPQVTPTLGRGVLRPPDAGPTLNCQSYTGSGKSIPDNSPTGIYSAINVLQDGYVQAITVTAGLDHPAPEELEGRLCRPNGCYTVLFSGDGQNGTTTYSDDGPTLPAEPLNASNIRARGLWRLQMVDSAEGNTGALTGWSLTLCTSGQPTPQPSPTWAFTPEPQVNPVCTENFQVYRKLTTSSTFAYPTPSDFPATCPATVPSGYEYVGTLTGGIHQTANQHWTDDLTAATLDQYLVCSEHAFRSYAVTLSAQIVSEAWGWNLSDTGAAGSICAGSGVYSYGSGCSLNPASWNYITTDRQSSGVCHADSQQNEYWEGPPTIHENFELANYTVAMYQLPWSFEVESYSAIAPGVQTSCEPSQISQYGRIDVDIVSCTMDPIPTVAPTPTTMPHCTPQPGGWWMW
jgi:subtilisin-like proprotein convertase family protein